MSRLDHAAAHLDDVFAGREHLDDAGCQERFLLRDRDGKFPALMDEILAEAGIKTVLTGFRTSPALARSS
ncbi:hypothetical protein ABGB18_45485 [Nonomuraea sp. B12E4]|uniref:hypothetical protein n=1 Tax=Nonomuraea sp. B12E4 TaxID=3153564 RepID=UPI00325DF731